MVEILYFMDVKFSFSWSVGVMLLWYCRHINVGAQFQATLPPLHSTISSHGQYSSHGQNIFCGPIYGESCWFS